MRAWPFAQRVGRTNSICQVTQLQCNPLPLGTCIAMLHAVPKGSGGGILLLASCGQRCPPEFSCQKVWLRSHPWGPLSPKGFPVLWGGGCFWPHSFTFLPWAALPSLAFVQLLPNVRGEPKGTASPVLHLTFCPSCSPLAAPAPLAAVPLPAAVPQPNSLPQPTQPKPAGGAQPVAAAATAQAQLPPAQATPQHQLFLKQPQPPVSALFYQQPPQMPPLQVQQVRLARSSFFPGLVSRVPLPLARGPERQSRAGVSACRMKVSSPH